MKTIYFLVIIFLLGSCQFSPDYQKPAVQKPKGFVESPRQKDHNKKWWRQFNDSKLDNLIREALEANTDILIAMSNLSKARAQLGLVESQLFPQVNLQGSSTKTKTSKELKSANSGSIVNSLSLAAVFNYELDLWGAARNADKSAGALLLVAEYNKHATQITISSNVATSYFNLSALNAQISITKRLIAVQEEIYKTNNNLFQAGVNDVVALSQAEVALENTKATLPPLVQALREQETALAILVGQVPQVSSQQTLTAIDRLPIPPSVPNALSSGLLEQRPDINAAEQNLISANANIGVAKAAYFPTVSLTGLVGLQSSYMSSLFSKNAGNRQRSGTIEGSIFDFGKTKAAVKIAKETKNQYLIQYRQTVYTAFGEVIDALSARKTSLDNYVAWQKREKAMDSIMRLTKQRYSRGNVAYLEVLNAEQDLLQEKITGIRVKLEQLNAAVSLFQALGGGWE